MTSQSHRTLLSPCLKPGLSLIEILIAIGILAVSMMLIAAAFPAGITMSIAVSDETTSQAVFQKALAEIEDNVEPGDFTPDDTYKRLVLLLDSAFAEADKSRKLDENSPFSWAALIRPIDDNPTATGPMRKLCQVIIVVSRRPSGSHFENESLVTGRPIPELRSVSCTDSSDTARTITVAPAANFDLVPSSGYLIDSKTGIAYSIISRNVGAETTITVLSEPPGDVATDNRNFWVIPGPYEDGNKYGQSSPAIRVFQAMLYLP